MAAEAGLARNAGSNIGVLQAVSLWKYGTREEGSRERFLLLDGSESQIALVCTLKKIFFLI